jgi:ubiquitin-protein ligase
MGFFSDPRSRRLARDYEEMKKLREESSVLEFKTHGDPPDNYEIVFKGKCLSNADPVEFVKKVNITMILGSEYPRSAPSHSLNTKLLHPNISGGTICTGNFAMNPGVQLTAFVTYLWDIVRMAIHNSYGGYGGVKDWHEVEKAVGFPTDPRILRDKSAAPQPKAPEAESGDILVIEGSRGRGPADMARKIMDYLEDGGFEEGVQMYTRAEWLKTGEPRGRDAVVTIVTDGRNDVPLWKILNYETELEEYAKTLFAEFLDDLGLFFGYGDYDNTFHVYRK